MDAKARLAATLERVRNAAERTGRNPGAVRLIAVSKTFDAEAIAPVIRAGQRDFGENRVQEAQRKWGALRESFPDVFLHLIGPLQTNKASEAVALFDAIHSVDREKVAAALAKEIAGQGRNPLLFIQVNTGREPQKAGIGPEETAAFVQRCREVHGLSVTGLMCIPPADEDPAPHFSLLRSLAQSAELPHLSMGMSGDFEAAIEHGATHVRVGSAIFGDRSAPAGGIHERA